jgi:hypothetical protein
MVTAKLLTGIAIGIPVTTIVLANMVILVWQASSSLT